MQAKKQKQQQKKNRHTQATRQLKLKISSYDIQL